MIHEYTVDGLYLTFVSGPYMCICFHHSAISSACKVLDASVAALIRWSDEALLHGDGALNTQAATGVIGDLQQAIQVRVAGLGESVFS